MEVDWKRECWRLCSTIRSALKAGSSEKTRAALLEAAAQLEQRIVDDSKHTVDAETISDL